MKPSPAIEIFIDEGDKVKFGQSELEVLFTPGHSPASISLLNRESAKFLSQEMFYFKEV
jgi:hydroxyacylglutathione hydrolase